MISSYRIVTNIGGDLIEVTSQSDPWFEPLTCHGVHVASKLIISLTLYKFNNFFFLFFVFCFFFQTNHQICLSTCEPYISDGRFFIFIFLKKYC
jgi:hypothetical protein